MTDNTGEPWRRRSGEFSPTYYAHKGPDATSEALRELLVERVGRDASVLELGCNVGRHLAHLHEDGFSELTGVDINSEAVELLRETYPGLAVDGEFVVADLAAFLPGVATDAFDAVFSVETLQHVPPADSSVFDDVARVAGELLVTVENEHAGETDEEPGGTERGVTHVDEEITLYHRDWADVFSTRGMRPVAERDGDRDTLRAFVPS